MSFTMKCGYDLFRKQVLNISLKRSEKWTNGLVMIKHNMVVSNLLPRNENKLEIVKYNDTHTLLLNNAIIYEDNQIFSYKIDLEWVGDLDLNDPKIYDFIDCNYVECYALKRYDTQRTLN